MIVYIIGGKTASVKDAINYISDDSKTAKISAQSDTNYLELCEDLSFTEFRTLMKDSVNRTLEYIGDESKAGHYISGYLCNPNLAEFQFWVTKKINCSRIGEKVEEDTGNYFYHIIQSFPEEIEISDDEVHRCGIELVEKLGLYQAVVASHVHPVIDEEGEHHGKCKHNHIVMNSHIYHEFVDPNNPYTMKYNDCRESYARLRLINDQIAIEHGLPIIANPEKGHGYSWFESRAINEGKSWKQRVRIDISNIMRICNDMNSFVETMQAVGYEIRFGHSRDKGDYIAYTTPENQRIRDYNLGRGYLKNDLEKYWSLKKAIATEQKINDNSSNNKLEDLLLEAHEPLFVQFEKKMSQKRIAKRREQNLNIRRSYTNYYPLGNQRLSSTKAELTYFQPEETYQIVNAQHQTITDVYGKEILEYFNRLYERQLKLAQEEEKRRRQQKESEYYSSPGFIKSATRTPYKIRAWDENGNRRSTIELILILAIVVIQNEAGKWDSTIAPDIHDQEVQRRPIYAHRDWKVQNMVDTVRIAREENIQSIPELEERLNAVGKETSKSKAEVRRLTAAKNRMDVLKKAIEGYQNVKDILEKIYAMPDSPEKTQRLQEYSDEIEDYNMHKAVMYRHNVTSQEDIELFLERYEEMEVKLPAAEVRADTLKNQYRRLSMLKYNLQLAENKMYCYGPDYNDLALSMEVRQEPLNEKTAEHTRQSGGFER